MNTENQKPCLVQTERGFSVNYKEKFLYSKYNPPKMILQKIESMEFLAGTVVLCMSPVLGYGLNELREKLPENCAILLCECDKELHEFTENENSAKSDFAFLSIQEIYNLPVILQKPSYTFECGFSLAPLGTYRRVVRIDFSAGVQFHADFYNELENACVNSVKQFWTNRITLSKFGRRFSRNIFRNLKTLSETTPLENFIGKIEKPIVVFGSGESSEIGVQAILRGGKFSGKDGDLQNEIEVGGKSSRENYFILCADTAFPMLKGYGIVPDGIVIDEAQSVIAESFIGAGRTSVHIFQSLCSLPHVAGRFFPPERISFYATEYASNNFFEDLKSRDFFPPIVQAFGSVGITAFCLANMFKASADIPVIVYGLDFAYSCGKTHARGATAHKRRLRETCRLNSVSNYGACFGSNVIKMPSVNNESQKLIYSTPILRSYAETFEQVKRNISDLVKEWKSADYGVAKDSAVAGDSLETVDLKNENSSEKKSVEKYLKTELETLEELRDILSGEKVLPNDERDLKIREICQAREYLYLHFPDGYKFSDDISFLKRIRNEIDFFLKYLK